MATPPDFTAGQVLTAAQMNAVGQWLVTSASFTTVAGFNLPDNSFTADYTNYRLIIRLTAVATDADFTGRMRAAGTNATGATDYTYGWGGPRTGSATFGGAASGGTSSFSFFESDNNALYAPRYVADINIYGPALAQQTNILGSIGYVDKAVTDQFLRTGGGSHILTTAYDSFAFISTQNITGRYWLYGYRD